MDVGRNKLAKFADLRTFRNVIQVPADFQSFHDHPLKGQWNKRFFGNSSPLVLELGCGKGEYTVSLAEMFPEKNFIGIDIKGARIWLGAKLAIERQLTNVGFLRTNIELIDFFFGEMEVGEIWLTFPDPQMEKIRRRLTSVSFLEKYRKIMPLTGIVHLKTDSNFLFQYTQALIEKNQLPVWSRIENLYASELLNEVLSVKTFYEKQWIERGIEIKYLSFGLNGNEQLTEPGLMFEKDRYRSFGRSANYY